MDRSRLAGISEIVTSLAIVFTLIYLTVEVRQNTNALYAQSRETMLTVSQASLFAQMQYPELVTSFIKDDPLTAEEIIRLHAYLIAFMRGREFAWLQFQDGIIDEDQWNTELAALKAVLQPYRNRDWWRRLGRPLFSDRYTDFVDGQIQDEPPTDELYENLLNWKCEGCTVEPE